MTLREALNFITHELANVCETKEQASQEARLLLFHLLDIDLTEYALLQTQPFPENLKKQCDEALNRRIVQNEPFSRQFSKKFFWKNFFTLNKETLDPRPETECLIDYILNREPLSYKGKILDLGTGTGCILLSLLAERPYAKGTGIDLSAKALEAFAINAQNLNVADRCNFYQSDWFSNVFEKFDCIVGNPPYIDPTEHLPQEVLLFDPPLALYAKHKGLAAYQEIAKSVLNHLNKDGYLILEIGSSQKEDICQLFEPLFESVKIFKDLALKDRFVVCEKARIF